MTAIAEILNQEIFGVSIGRLGIFFIILLVTFIIRSVFFYVIDKKIIALVKKTKTEFDDLVINAVRTPLSYLILLHGFYLAIEVEGKLAVRDYYKPGRHFMVYEKRIGAEVRG